MERKKRLFIIVLAVIITACFFLFFKTYSEKNVSPRADYIVSIDTKRITNSVIWTYITTPSLWKVGKIFSSDGKVDWKDMVKVPDYVFIFHVSGETAAAWYTVLEVKDEKDFEEGLAVYGFQKVDGTNRYISKQTGLEFIKNGKQVLVGNAAIDDKTLITEIANELFVQGKHIDRVRLQQNTEIANHVAWTFTGNDLVKSIAGSAGFDKETISSFVDIQFTKSVFSSQRLFRQSNDLIAGIGFAQPSASLYSLIPDSSKQRVSRLVNFNIDSLFLPSNYYYQMQIGELKNRVDTAISYSFDDDFNQVEKKVINNVIEPSFSFGIYGKDVTPIYDYWNNNKTIEKTAEGDLFTPMPLVKSYCHINADSSLNIQSNNFNKQQGSTLTDSCLLYGFVNMLHIPDSMMKYVPTQLVPLIRKISSINTYAKNTASGSITIETTISKRKEKEWFE